MKSLPQPLNPHPTVTVALTIDEASIVVRLCLLTAIAWVKRDNILNSVYIDLFRTVVVVQLLYHRLEFQLPRVVKMHIRYFGRCQRVIYMIVR